MQISCFSLQFYPLILTSICRILPVAIFYCDVLMVVFYFLSELLNFLIKIILQKSHQFPPVIYILSYLY